ncbi:hypothetical protein FQA39_LY09817 [Lamprigera yunnana]|nr:hypothetical protein FQA39_LY09817 [Lamprigera yunnana]
MYKKSKVSEDIALSWEVTVTGIPENKAIRIPQKPPRDLIESITPTNPEPCLMYKESKVSEDIALSWEVTVTGIPENKAIRIPQKPPRDLIESITPTNPEPCLMYKESKVSEDIALSWEVTVTGIPENKAIRIPQKPPRDLIESITPTNPEPWLVHRNQSPTRKRQCPRKH